MSIQEGLFLQPSLDQIDSVLSFVPENTEEHYFGNHIGSFPEHLFVNVDEFIHELLIAVPRRDLLDLRTIAEVACKNYNEVDELFSLDDYMTTEIYMRLLGEFEAEGLPNMQSTAQRITDDVTNAARYFLQAIDNLLTGLGLPCVTGFGCVWRPVQITQTGIMHLQRCSALAISLEVGI